jgi:tripartite-type tricarboxylate transporter receptor subunit TctC
MRTCLWMSAAVMSAPLVVLAQDADPAKNYPMRPARVIAGSPGSTSDLSARFIAQKLTDAWRRQVVVERLVWPVCTGEDAAAHHHQDQPGRGRGAEDG